MHNSNLLNEINKIKKMVEEWIESEINYQENTLNLASHHLFKAGGKRIRPFIMSQIFSHYSIEIDKILPLLAAIEILHTFTLIHDDIMDKDLLRRGKPSVHNKYGESIAILAGDILSTQVFQIISTLSLSKSQIVSIVQEFSRSLIKICEGQAFDMKFENIESVSEKEYMNMIELKTAELFRLSANIASLISNAPVKEAKIWQEIGYNYGMAFQIIDDILGITANESELGKPIGSDIRQGKKTFITLYALNNLNKQDLLEFKRILSNKRLNDSELGYGIKLIEKTGALEQARLKAKFYTVKGLNLLSSLQNSTNINFLKELFTYSLNRLK